MNKFISIASLIFAAITVVHLYRIIENWEVTVAGTDIPMCASYTAIVVCGIMALWGAKLGARRWL